MPTAKRGKKTKSPKKKLTKLALRRKQKKVIFHGDPDLPPGYTIKCEQNANHTCTKHVFDETNHEVMHYTVAGDCPAGCIPL